MSKNKNNEKITFKVGDQVAWASGGGGGRTRKQGEVVKVVPAGQTPPFHNLRNNLKAKSAYGGGSRRDHESYVVLVPAKSVRAMATLYWPRVTQLEPVACAS